jgi:hypothetical protein
MVMMMEKTLDEAIADMFSLESQRDLFGQQSSWQLRKLGARMGRAYRNRGGDEVGVPKRPKRSEGRDNGRAASRKSRSGREKPRP